MPVTGNEAGDELLDLLEGVALLEIAVADLIFIKVQVLSSTSNIQKGTKKFYDQKKSNLHV